MSQRPDGSQKVEPVVAAALGASLIAEVVLAGESGAADELDEHPDNTATAASQVPTVRLTVARVPMP
jgi:hypothetical protein